MEKKYVGIDKKVNYGSGNWRRVRVMELFSFWGRVNNFKNVRKPKRGNHWQFTTNIGTGFKYKDYVAVDYTYTTVWVKHQKINIRMWFH